MELFPAVLIGGPPHMGKSVLAYSLTHALRERGVQHYVLRAYPDGEGDWANESDQELVRRIRIKGQGTPRWVSHICRDIAARHLPLIVDVGGRPTPDQERIFDHCTHAILLTGDTIAHRDWEAMLVRHGLILIADLHSQLHGQGLLTDAGPVLHGVITGLERGAMATGPAFDALVERLAHLFAYDPAELRHAHLTTAPVETTVDLDRLARSLGVPFAGEKAVWAPCHLPAVLDYLPENTPLAVYGRGPNWLYAALACLAYPEPFHQFDVRLGWITPPTLRLGSPSDAPVQVRCQCQVGYNQLTFTIPTAYLDYSAIQTVIVPPISPKQGLVLNGKLPLWLWTSLAATYRNALWLAVYQPQLGDQAVVISSHMPGLLPGHLVAPSGDPIGSGNMPASH